jgi:hypothetical protein
MAREYIRHTRAWYYEATRGDWTEEFQLTDGQDDLQEFNVRWYGDIRGLDAAPKVECFNDAFMFLFNECSDLLLGLHGHDVTPDEFEARLELLGWVDVTRTKSPYNTR